MKKYIFVAVFMVFLMGGGILVSAGFWDDTYTRITGKATSGEAQINVQVGNSVPSIPTVEFSSIISPSEDSYRTAYIAFQAKDMNGVKDLDMSTAKLIVSKSGEVAKTVSCTNVNNISSKIANFSCSIDIWYFETAASDWNINVSISDSKDKRGENSSNDFTYSELTAMVFAPLSMSWPAIEVTDSDILSSTNPILMNNTGNDNIAIGSLKINATDLEGEEFAGEYIYAGNFTVDVANTCNTGVIMQNQALVAVDNSQLPKGNHSVNDGSTGQEQLYFCLEAVNDDISAQTYSTTAGGPWKISIE